MTTKDIIDKYRCKKCGGYGWVDIECTDRQCGDSTWDHYCTSDYIKCVDCMGKKLEQILADALLDTLEELETLKETLKDFEFIRKIER
jgi:hypothetical protein